MQDILRLFKHDAVHDNGYEYQSTLAPDSVQNRFTAPPAVASALVDLPVAQSAVQKPQHRSHETLSGATGANAHPKKFTIPKSLESEYQAYKDRDVWASRR